MQIRNPKSGINFLAKSETKIHLIFDSTQAQSLITEQIRRSNHIPEIRSRNRRRERQWTTKLIRDDDESDQQTTLRRRNDVEKKKIDLKKKRTSTDLLNRAAIESSLQLQENEQRRFCDDEDSAT
ncbi:unnamed protein product [Microthlaspi erraticum]|uniref:Uncharacterized protein n=1 Tax=Microthlaspi erraticum TaxID=1685480 RepID=A0A6D2ILU5_9BRAS|nr:unnamed protein product [Microthlaspi erraticum]